jgi:O-antigen/teichoic acid export membrane protein
MCISLYTSRVILQSLGVEDYGVYNVVGGFVTMFGILTTSLSASISRFVTVELGKGDIERQRVVFSTSIKIQLLMSLIIIVVAECVGTWFIINQMQIPEGRLAAAQWVFHCSIISFVISLLTVPFSATIIAHEHMSAVAYIGILDAILKLSIVYILTIVPVDKLIFYAILMVCVHLLICIIYVIYSKHKFPNSIGHSKFDGKTFKEMWGFAGWSFLGNSAYIFNTQGVNMVMNVFFGVVVNAARGIAMQVTSAAQQFATSFTTALNPQITKSFAAGDREYSFKLVFQGAKLSYFLLLLVSLPLILEASTILNFWLGIVPDYSVIFVQLVLVYGLSESISYTMVTLMLATGNIRNYQIIVGGCQMLNFPLSYVILKLGSPPEYTFVVSICVAILCLFLRLIMLNRMVKLPIGHFLHRVALKCFLVTLVAFILPSLVVIYNEPSFLRLLLTGFVSVFSVMFFALTLGCSANERKFILNKATTMLKSKLHKG